MTQSVTQPTQPEQPTPIQPPTLTAGIAPELENPKALLKRSKEVAREVKRYARENPSLKVTFEKKIFPRREIVQFCAACFQVTAMVTMTEEVISKDDKELGFVAIAHALNSAGRVVSGAEAACMHSEADWAGKPSYQLRSMSQTRACSKALCNLFAYVLQMAGFCATPAEEMGPGEPHQRELMTQCDRCDCTHKISNKRRQQTKKKYGKGLCSDCEKKLKAEQGEKLMAPLNDPKQVADYVKSRKANGAQSIVAAMDAGEEEMPA
jgi:hypothetical protein